MAELAGKNASSASSESVMSTGVPKTVVVLKKARRPDSVISRGTGRFALAGNGIRAKLIHEVHENRIGGDLNLMIQASEQMRTPFGQVGNARR